MNARGAPNVPVPGAGPATDGAADAAPTAVGAGWAMVARGEGAMPSAGDGMAVDGLSRLHALRTAAATLAAA